LGKRRKSFSMGKLLMYVAPVVVAIGIQFLFVYLSWMPRSEEVALFYVDLELVVPVKTREEILIQPAPSPNELAKWFEENAECYGVPRRTLEYIAYCESRYNPTATNGKHAGMYQFNPTTWMATRGRMGMDPNPDLRFDAEEAIRTAAFKISNGGIGAWAYCSSRLAMKS